MAEMKQPLLAGIAGLALISASCIGTSSETYEPVRSHMMMAEKDRDVFTYVDPHYWFSEEDRPRSFVGPVSSLALSDFSTLTYEGERMFTYDPDTRIKGDEQRRGYELGHVFTSSDRRFVFYDSIEHELQTSTGIERYPAVVILEEKSVFSE